MFSGFRIVQDTAPGLLYIEGPTSTFSEIVSQWNPQVHIEVCTFQHRLNSNPYIDNVNQWIMTMNRLVVGMNSLASPCFNRMTVTGIVPLTVCKHLLYVLSIDYHWWGPYTYSYAHKLTVPQRLTPSPQAYKHPWSQQLCFGASEVVLLK